MKKILLIATISTSLLFSSCMTTQTVVGEYRAQTGRIQTYDKAKQVWFFYGLIPLGTAQADTPQDGNCKITTTLTFGDLLISAITAGLINTYTIKVETKVQ